MIVNQFHLLSYKWKWQQLQRRGKSKTTPSNGMWHGENMTLGLLLTDQRHAVWFVGEHRNWQVCHWCPIRFTDDNRFMLSTCERCERVWSRCDEQYAACDIIKHDWFGGGSLMVWGGISLEGCTDPQAIASSTLTPTLWNPQLSDRTLEGPWFPPGEGQCLSLCVHSM